MNDPLQRLIDYDRAERELAAAHRLLAGVPDDMRALHEEFTAGSAEIEALEAQVLAAKRARSTAEGAIADAQEKLKKFQAQVPRVRNQREYGALLSEIDHAKADLRRLEEEALAAIEAAEQATGELERRREAFTELASRHAAGLAAWEARKPEVARHAEALASRTEELRNELPRPIVAQYARIAERYGGEALSALRRSDAAGPSSLWFCSTCNYEIRPQVAVEVRARGRIVQCEGCRRFLYTEPEE